ncbi:hypothetical protein Q7689_06105 [Nocardiopsis tropica]|nr:hypothetical protein [Nocardiopsis tropica]
MDTGVEVPVGEPVARPVRPVDGQSGLAHTRWADEHRDRNPGPGFGCRRVQVLKMSGAVHERGGGQR